MAITIKLSKELNTHKGPVRELELNEPQAGSFVRHGEPFHTKMEKDGGVDIRYDNKAMLDFLSDMTGVDRVILETLPSSDYYTLRTQAVSLLMGGLGASPTEA